MNVETPVGGGALQALPQTSSVAVVTSHSVCPSPLYDRLGVDLLQKIKHTLAVRPSAFSEVPPDIPALFPCIPCASDPDSFSPSCLTGL